MPEVIIVDLQHVTIDGVNAGSLVSAAANHGDIATELEAAVVEWLTAYAAQSAKEATDRGAEHATKLNSDLDAAVAKIDQLNQKLISLHADYTADVEKVTAEFNARLDEMHAQATQQIQALTATNQTLSQELNQARQQIVSSFSLATQAMSGSSESARAAAQEWHRVDVAAMEAIIAAKKAATTPSNS